MQNSCKIWQIDNLYGLKKSTYRSSTMLNAPVSLKDFENYAKLTLPKSVFDYYASGATAQQTLGESTAAFKRLRLRPRVLRDVSTVDMATTILGEKIDFPVGISPTAFHKLAHPDGEVATAKGAAQLGTCMILSSWSNTLLEDVARNSSGLKWFQVNIFKRLDIIASVIKNAEKEGYKAIVVTIDNPYSGIRYDDLRNHFALPPHLSLINYKSLLESKVDSEENSKVGYASAFTFHDPAMTWSVIDWLRTVTKLPIVIKGILTAEDAKVAVQHSVDAILISNHGCRQLDGVPTTIEALPEIVAAVEDKVEVYLDGGIRFGTDVFKALALGAKAVFVGRPILWGLAYKGEEGVKNVLQILKDELKLTMGLCGCRSLKDITKEMVVHQSYYSNL